MGDIRIPPHDIAAEAATIGSCMADGSVVHDVLAIIPPHDPSYWYKPGHFEVYKALASLAEQNKPIDALVVRDWLKAAGTFEMVGGIEAIVDLHNSVPSAANAEHYARIVRDKAVLRRLITTAGEIIDSAYAQQDEAAVILDNAERSLLDATQECVQSAAVDAAVGMRSAVAGLEAGGAPGLGLMSGLRALDQMTNGFRPGELIILAARPSVGKSALAAQIAETAALDNGYPVLFFSLEMTADELAYRMLCGRAGLNGFTMRQRPPDAVAIAKLRAVAEASPEGVLLIDQTPQLTALEMRAKARRVRNLSLLVVDYLQLMRCPGAESRQQEVASISRSLAAMAKELHVPVLALAQLNRQTEGREGHRPRLSDLRESGQIEQDADMVLLLHRPHLYDQSKPDNLAEVVVAKNRNGPTGMINLAYLSHLTRFANWAEESPFETGQMQDTPF